MVAASVDPRAGRPQCGNGLPGRSERWGYRGPFRAPDVHRGRRSAGSWSSELPHGAVLEGAVPDLIVLDRERHGGATHVVADDVRGAGAGRRHVSTLDR